MSFNLTTPFGIVALKPTNNDHIYIELAPVSPDLDAHGHRYAQPFTVRGVSYHGGIHVYRWADGSFHLGPEAAPSYDQRQSLYLRRHNPSNPSNDRASDSAERTILQTLLPAANAWAAANPYALDAAEQERIASTLARLQQQRTDLMQQLNEVDKQLAELQPRSRAGQLTTD
jgi:hypothetical protein